MSESPNLPVQADPRTFGRLISEIRVSKGFTQPQVVSRVPAHYGDESAYRRVERGSRKPKRDAAIAILRHGLEVDSLARINQALSLLAYAPLDRGEIEALKLTDSERDGITVTSEPIPDEQTAWIRRLSAHPSAIATGVVAVSLALAALVAVNLTADPAGTFGAAVVYGCLYAVSVLLESQHQGEREARSITAAIAFAMMLIASAGALAIDRWCVRIGSNAGLAVALAVSWAAAGVQWLVVRPALADRPVVPLRFQPLPAQAAHLKNTLYFLILPTVFWLPPIHTTVVLQRERQLGHTAVVQQALSHGNFIISKGTFCLGPTALTFVFFAIVLVSIVMGCRLLDNLKPDRRQNGYCVLFYTRAALFFGLAILCLGRYANELVTLAT